MDVKQESTVGRACETSRPAGPTEKETAQEPSLPKEAGEARPKASSPPRKYALRDDMLTDEAVVRTIESARTFFRFDAPDGALTIPQCSRVTDHGQDCATSLPRHVSRRLLESVYAHHAPRFLAGKCIGIHVNNPYVDGIGDVVSLSKMAKLIMSTGARVVLLDPGRDSTLVKTYFPFVAQGDIIDTYRSAAADLMQGIDAVVIARGTDIGPRYGCFYDYGYASLRIPVLNVLEYNIHAVMLGPDVIETGFSSHGVGFFRDAEMYDLALLDSQDRAQRKEELYDRLRVASHEGTLAESGQWPAVKPETIHTSYCTWTLSKIINVSAHVHLEAAGDLTLYVASKVPWRSQICDVEKNVLAPPAGFARLEIEAPGLHTSMRAPVSESQEISAAPRAERTMTVRGFSRLPPSTFSGLMKLSDFVIVTGDQSVSEAISLGIPYAYQVCSHKWGVAEALQQAPELSPRAQTWQKWLAGGCPRPFPSRLTSSVRDELTDRSMRLAHQCDLSDRFLARVMRRVGDHDFDDLQRYQMHFDRQVEKVDLEQILPQDLKMMSYLLSHLSSGLKEVIDQVWVQYRSFRT